MARAVSSDYLQVFKFSVRDVSRGSFGGFVGGGDALDFGGGETNGIGFSAVSMPEITGETFQINEGAYPFPRYVLRRGTIGQLQLSRGIVPRDSDFYLWFHAALFGDVNNHKNLLVTMNRRDGTPAKGWLFHDCLPIGVKPAPDLDATSDAIGIATLTIQPYLMEEIPVE